MSLREAVVAAGRKGPSCSYATMRDNLEPTKQAELDECMGDDTMTGTAIAKALFTEWDVKIHSSTVQRHRRGECACGTR